MTVKLVVNGLRDTWLKNEEEILKITVWLGALFMKLIKSFRVYNRNLIAQLAKQDL